MLSILNRPTSRLAAALTVFVLAIAAFAPVLRAWHPSGPADAARRGPLSPLDCSTCPAVLIVEQSDWSEDAQAGNRTVALYKDPNSCAWYPDPNYSDPVVSIAKSLDGTMWELYFSTAAGPTYTKYTAPVTGDCPPLGVSPTVWEREYWYFDTINVEDPKIEVRLPE